MCTCQIHHKSSGGRKAVEHRHLKFHPTEVDEEEICIHCGHYAWEEPQHVIYPRTSTIPWRSEVQGKNTPNAWHFNTEVRDAYFEKTYYSDYELDLGDAFDASKEAAEKRTKIYGHDPVQKEFFKDYSAKRKGLKHIKDTPDTQNIVL